MLKTDEKDNLFHLKQFKEWLVKRFFCFVFVFWEQAPLLGGIYIFFYISQKLLLFYNLILFFF